MNLTPVQKLETREHVESYAEECGWENANDFLFDLRLGIDEVLGRYVPSDAEVKAEEPITLVTKEASTFNFHSNRPGSGYRVYTEDAPLYRDASGRVFMSDSDLF
jgi:hypothetical protein